MKKILFILSIASAGLLQSCFSPPPLEIELPPHQPKLSIISQVVPDQTMFVVVSKSFSALNQGKDSIAKDSAFLASLTVEHALVTITFAGQTHELHHIGHGVYASNEILQVADEMYALYVKDSATGLECTSTSRMLPRVSFNPDSVHVGYELFGTDTNNIFVDYSFDDPPGENYYLIDYTSLTPDSTRLRNGAFNFGNGSQKFVLLADKELVDHHYHGRMNIGLPAHRTILFTLTNISKEYYEYLTTYRKTGSLFNQLTGEPIDFPTNVVNGYGFFTTHNPDIKVLDL
jgi:hypothetical protein